MTREEALEKFELESDASSSEIQQQYQELYNEFQMRITNAPTDHQRKLYRKKLEELEIAYAFLTGTSTADADSELPGMAPTADSAPPKSQPRTAGVLSKAQALKLLGLSEPFTKQVLDKSYQAKSKECEKGIKNALNEDVAKSYERTLAGFQQANEVLKPLVQEPQPPKPPKASKQAPVENPESPKKKNLVVFIMAGLLLLIALLFVFKPWEPSVDPEIKERFAVLKGQADLLAEDQEWERALGKYEAANKLVVNKVVQDSISSITGRIEGLALSEQKKESDKAVAEVEREKQALAKREREAAAKELEKQEASQLKKEEKKRKRERINSIKMVYVAGGSYKMGCTSEQSDCGDDESPVHWVELNSYYIGKYEVTQSQWQSVMGSNPSYFKCSSCPVEYVSWNEVEEFIRKLNAQTGKNYRLPTEAEWEYASRGGNQSRGYKYSGSNNIGSVAWYDGNSGDKTHAVGQKQSNELGIYDMSGNVREWCSDWYGKGYYSQSPGGNPKGAYSHSYRVSRGGGWHEASGCRSAARYSTGRGYDYAFLGFRLALSSR